MFYQVEFPKTHEIERLLALVSTANPEAADALGPAKWLGPFAVDIRYPGDAAEMLPGDEVRAVEIARFAKESSFVFWTRASFAVPLSGNGAARQECPASEPLSTVRPRIERNTSTWGRGVDGVKPTYGE
jgi:hypothetical protein